MNTLDAPHGDAALLVDEIETLRKKSYNATVIGRINITSDLARFQIRPDAGIPSFEPGQYVAVGMGYWEPRVPNTQEENLESSKLRKMVRRAYSISCPLINEQGSVTPCSELDYLEFYIVLVRQAEKPPALTPRLFMLQPGDRLTVEKKIVGHYVLGEVGPDDPVCFFATGTGEAPHNAMAAHLLKNGHRGPILLASCVRKQEDLGYLKIHRQLAAKYPNYRYLTYTTREAWNLDALHPDYVGKQYLQSELESGRMERDAGFKIDPSNTHVYLCGNPEMIGYEPPGSDPLSSLGMIQLLEKRGFRREGAPGAGLIRFEKYW